LKGAQVVFFQRQLIGHPDAFIESVKRGHEAFEKARNQKPNGGSLMSRERETLIGPKFQF
jgi:hypothetical protein